MTENKLREEAFEKIAHDSLITEWANQKKEIADLKAEKEKEYERGVCDGFCCKHDDCPYNEKCKMEIEQKACDNLLDEIEGMIMSELHGNVMFSFIKRFRAKFRHTKAKEGK